MKTPQQPQKRRSSSILKVQLQDPNEWPHQPTRRLSRRPSILVDLETRLNSLRNSSQAFSSSSLKVDEIANVDDDDNEINNKKELLTSSHRTASTVASSFSSSFSTLLDASFRQSSRGLQQEDVNIQKEKDEEKEETIEADACTTQTTKSLERPRASRVRFDSVNVRSYKIHVDDNPAVSTGGPAIALGWEYQAEPVVALDAFEEERAPQRIPLKDLKISRVDRERMLLQAGASRSEMQRFVKRINIAKRKRRKTLEALNNSHYLPFKGAPETVEGVSRRLGRLLGLRRSVDQDVAKIMSRVPSTKGSSSSN